MDVPIEELPFLLDLNNQLIESIESIYFPAAIVGQSGTSQSGGELHSIDN